MTHAYNPMCSPTGYLITFHTYGTRLHGDPSGSSDRKGHNIPGTPYLPANPARVKLERILLKHPPVTLNAFQRTLVTSTIRQVCVHNNWTLHAVHVRTNHVHVVVTAFRAPELIMNSFKAWCTRNMRGNGLWHGEHSPWSRHGSMRYLWDERAVCGATEYVLYGQGEPLPDGRGTDTCSTDGRGTESDCRVNMSDGRGVL